MNLNVILPRPDSLWCSTTNVEPTQKPPTDDKAVSKLPIIKSTSYV